MTGHPTVTDAVYTPADFVCTSSLNSLEVNLCVTDDKICFRQDKTD